jgi:hypothetical protein
METILTREIEAILRIMLPYSFNKIYKLFPGKFPRFQGGEKILGSGSLLLKLIN